jgi:hypothetical protein
MRENLRDVIYTSKRKAIAFYIAGHSVKSDSPVVTEKLEPLTLRQRVFLEQLKGKDKKPGT